MGKQISLREAYEKVKKDSGNAPNNRLIALEKSIADYGSGWHSKEDSVALNKKLHFEKMRATAQSNDELLKKLNEISGSVVDQSNLYSQYKDADDYNKAKRKYQLDTKYGRLKTHEDYEKYYKSGNFEQANLPQDEKDYLLRLGYKLEYREAMSSLNVAKQRLEGLPKNITTNSPYNEQQRIKIQQEKKILEANIKKLESRIKEMDNMGGIYTGLNTEILSESGEYAFDQRWANKKAEMEEQNETTSEKDRIRKMAGLPTTEEERQKETLTDKEKIKLMSGQKVDKSDYYIDDIFKNAQPYQYLYCATDDEKRLYSFIKKRDGEGLAQKYLEDLKIAKLDKRLNQAQFKEAYDYSAQNGGTGFLGSLASIPTNLFSGIEYGAYRMAGLDGVRSTLASKSQGFREGTKSQIDSDVWDFVYDTTMSGLDSAAAVGFSAVAPWLGEVVLASSAAASTYNDALDRGISHGDALLTSLAAGVAESLFEHISIGKFLDGSDITKGFTKAGLRQAGKNILIEMGINASEEALTEVSNIITDTLINGNLSNYAIAVKDYYMQGMTPEEAKKTALADFGKQIVEAGASGLLMGFGFGTIGSVKGMAKSQISNSRNGGMVKANGNINELKIMANLSGVGEIKTVAEKLSEISKPSEIGYVYNRLVENAVESSVKQMTPILLENGAKEGGSNSAKARALQIAQSVFKKKDSNIANLMRNRVTSDVYTAFAKEGKYGGDMLLALKELASNPQPKAMTANDFVNSYGGEGPAVSGEIKGIASAPRTGTIHPITEAFGKSVAENLERQRPTPQRPKTKKITKTGEAVVKAIGKAMGVEVEFTDSAVDGVADGKTVDHKKVYISRYTVDPIKEVIKHEFTHTTEISKHYGKFQKYLFDESEAFKVWLKSKDYTKWPEMETDIIDLYKQNGETLDHEGAKTEIVAKFVSENLFKDSGTEVTETFLKELYLKDRNLFDRFVDWVKSVFARLKASGAVNKDIIKLEQKFIRLAETAKKQRVRDEAKQGKGQYSIVKDAKNRDIVVLDRNIFDGITNLKKRAEALEDWILKNFGGTKHNTSDYFFVVMNERTAGKMPFWNENMNATEYSRKLSAAEHIDELVKISKFHKHSENFKDKHKEFASKGWNYFKSYFTDGEFVYEADISVARSKEQAVVYNIGDIKRKGKYNKKESSYSLTGSPNELATSPNGAMNRNSNPSIPNSSKNVKGQYSLSFPIFEC